MKSTWIRQLFARPVTRTIRKSPRRLQLDVEELENRWVPNSYVVNSTGSSGSGSGLDGDLVYCITQANASSGANTITFSPTVFSSFQTITLSGAVLELSNTSGLQTITAPTAGVAISGGGSSGVFEVDTDVTATITGVTIEDGNSNPYGGGVNNEGTLTLNNCTISGNYGYLGGGVFNEFGTVTLNKCTVSGNTSFEGNGLFTFYGSITLNNSTVSNNTGGRYGGGFLDNRGALYLTNSTISGNTVTGYAGYYYTYGGYGAGVFSFYGTTNLSNCTVSGNSGNLGGGLMNEFGTDTLSQCTISGNTAAEGGGLFTFYGSLTVNNDTTVTDNTAPYGAGILNNRGTLDLTDATVSGNTASTRGGGIFNFIGTAYLTSSNVTDNYSPLGGGIATEEATATLTNSTVSGNTGTTGGGILTYYHGTTTLSGTTVSNNTAEYGGGLALEVGSTATLTNCTVTGNSASVVGGGLASQYGNTAYLTGTTVSDNYGKYSGGLYNAGTADLTKCTVTGNTATKGAGIGNFGYTGATTSHNGVLNLTSTSVTGNTATEYGGGLQNNGGTATLTNSTVSGNTAADGGGIYNGAAYFQNTYGATYHEAGTLTVTNSTVSGNTATLGGGLLNLGFTGANSDGAIVSYITVNDSTFSTNTSTEDGGGIGNEGGVATLTNCTISGNSSTTGGGMSNRTVYFGSYSQTGMATLTGCTVSANLATSGGGLFNDGTETLGNSIVAGNTGSGTGPDAAGAFTSNGNNLIGETDGSSGWGSSDLTGTIAQPLDPLLSPLGNWGGTTETMALLPGSPAIDAGSSALIPSGDTTDQRGLSRTNNSNVDIGSFESSGFTITVTSGNNQSASVASSFTDQLIVTVTPNNPEEPVAGGVVTFTFPTSGASASITGGTGTIGANGEASVTVTANTITGSYTVTATAAGITNTADFDLTNIPGAATEFGVTAPASVIAGTPFTFTVTAFDAYGNIATGYTGTVTFSSTDLAASLPANSLLTSGVGTFMATLVTSGDQTLTATDSTTSSITGTSPPIAVSSATSTAVTTTSPSTVTYGTPVTLTATITNTTSSTSPVAGSVAFYDNGVYLGDSTTITSSGSGYSTFTYTTTPTQLQVNGGVANIITAVYTPGAFFLGSTSSGSGDLSETITPYTLTVTGVLGVNKVYDSTTTATLNTTNAAVVGVFSGDTVTLITSGATGTFASKDVANGITVTTSGFTLGGAEGGDYVLTQPTTAADITPATLTISGVVAANKVYDSTTSVTLDVSGAELVGVFSGDSVTLSSTGVTGEFTSKNVANGITVTTSGFTIGGPQFGDYVLTQPTTTANITPFTLTLTGVTAINKVYNSSTAAALNTASATLMGVFSGDIATLVTTGAIGTFASKNVGTGITVTTSGFTVAGPEAEDYVIGQPTTTASITPFGLTLIGVTANNKVYDDTTAATLNTTNAKLLGIFNGDTVTLNTSGAVGTFATPEVGNAITVTTSGFTLGGPQAEDYTVVQPTTTANITAFGLTVGGVIGVNKVYDSTTYDTLDTTNAMLVGSIFSGDSVALNTTGAFGTFATKDVGNGIFVTTSGFTLTGAQAGDYTLTQPTTTADITPFGLSVTGVTAVNKVYDSTTVATLDTTNAGLVGVFSGDSVTLDTSGTTGTFASKDVGTNIPVTTSGFTLGGAQAGDYTVAQPTTTATITPFGLTTTGVTAISKVYDSTTAASLNTTGAGLVGVFSGDTVSLTTSSASGTFASKDVGTDISVSTSGFTLSGPQSGDYTVAQPTSTATITPFGLTTKGVVAVTKVYDSTTTATLNTANAGLVGVFSGDTVSLITGGATAVFATKNVGTTIPVTTSGFTLGGAQAGDYTIAQPSLTATITPFGLTTTGVTVENKVYNSTAAATINTANVTLVGVFSGDTVTLSTSRATGTFASKNVGTDIPVTTSGFTLGGAQAEDYTVTPPTLTATITPFGLTTTGVTVENKVYDGTTAATLNTANAGLVGVFSGDSVALVTSGASGTFASKDVSAAAPVTTSGFTLAGAQAEDYTVAQPTTTAEITPATLTIAGVTANNKVYDNTTTAALDTQNAVLVGTIYPGDSVTLVSENAIGTFASKTAANQIGVTTSGFTLTGPQAEDYTLIQPTTTANIVAVLNPTPVLVSGAMNGTVEVYTLGANGYYGNTPTLTLQPFGNISTDVRTAVGDVNGDGTPDYIFATGPGVPFEVTVISGAIGNAVLVAPFDPFLPAPPQPQTDLFTAGGFVSAGDFLNNGRDQIVVSPDQSGGPRVAIYDLNGAPTAVTQAYTAVGVNAQEVNPGSGLTRINNFLSVNPDFRGGARTAVGDLNGDGVPDLAIAAGFGGGPSVLVINGTKVATTSGFTASDDLVGDFFAFDSSLRDGAYLAIGDVLGNGQQDLILGPGAGGPAQVEILNGSELVNNGASAALANPVASFAPTGLGGDGAGLRVAVAPIGIGDEVNVVVGTGRNMPGLAKVYPVTGFTSGSTSEPSGGQLLSPFGGGALTDGIFVG